jgi:hypothetical protein
MASTPLIVVNFSDRCGPVAPWHGAASAQASISLASETQFLDNLVIVFSKFRRARFVCT